MIFVPSLLQVLYSQLSCEFLELVWFRVSPIVFDPKKDDFINSIIIDGSFNEGRPQGIALYFS